VIGIKSVTPSVAVSPGRAPKVNPIKVPTNIIVIANGLAKTLIAVAKI
jgi:hypothetical protein